MSFGTILNVVFLQGLWFSAVLGATHRSPAPAVVWFGGYVLWLLWRGELTRQDLALVLVATPLGFVLDTGWVRLGWLTFPSDALAPAFAPYWIALLWAGLALTVNSSMRWLWSRPGTAAALAATAAPLSYFAASRLGAVDVSHPVWFYVVVSLSWAAIVPALLRLARSLDGPRLLGQTP